MDWILLHSVAKRKGMLDNCKVSRVLQLSIYPFSKTDAFRMLALIVLRERFSQVYPGIRLGNVGCRISIFKAKLVKGICHHSPAYLPIVDRLTNTFDSDFIKGSRKDSSHIQCIKIIQIACLDSFLHRRQSSYSQKITRRMFKF